MKDKVHHNTDSHDESRQGEALLTSESTLPNSKKLYIESYGCAMNFSDSEVVASIMAKDGYTTTRNVEEADVILVNTCSIRDNAEVRVRKRLTDFRKHKKANPKLTVGILGCMAERLKKSLLEDEKFYLRTSNNAKTFFKRALSEEVVFDKLDKLFTEN